MSENEEASNPSGSKIAANENIELALRCGRDQLASQKEDLKSLRSQAQISLGLSGLIITIFATGAWTEDFIPRVLAASSASLTLGIGAATAFFSGSVYFAFHSLTTRREVTFDFSPKWILDNSDRSTVDLMSELASDTEAYFDKNELVLAEVASNNWWSMVLACLQIPAWILTLIS